MFGVCQFELPVKQFERQEDVAESDCLEETPAVAWTEEPGDPQCSRLVLERKEVKEIV